MLQLSLPNKFYQELAYIAKVMLLRFLGLDYHLSEHASNEIIIQTTTGRKLILNNSFFAKVEENYLQSRYLPNKAFCLQYTLTQKEKIPVIFGKPEITISEKEINCGPDLFASAFFMLTRWEEYVRKERDSHDRFPLEASLAYKADFYQQPVVDQYTELLWSMLHHLDPSLKRKKRSFQVIPTHDVDHLRRWRSLRKIAEAPYLDFVLQKKPLIGLKNLQSIATTLIKPEKDPYNTFDYLMQKSEHYGLQSRFYFMAGGLSRYDNNYQITSEEAKKLIDKVSKREHIIGFHPSYSTGKDARQWKKEWLRLKKVAPEAKAEGRQHYLRFSVPFTWQIWEDQGMHRDSSLYYPESPGFRCGTCHEFPVFNFLTRQTLKLKESPLICMENSFMHYQNLNPEAAREEVKKVYLATQKYQGNFVLLWHNSSLFTPRTRPYLSLYEDTLQGFS